MADGIVMKWGYFKPPVSAERLALKLKAKETKPTVVTTRVWQIPSRPNKPLCCEFDGEPLAKRTSVPVGAH
jgi:hypothetical protein